jgi:transposase
VRPRGPCGKCTQAEANLLKQAQNRRGRRLKNLARLARVDPKLLYPLRHRGEESQAHIALIRSRDVLVELLRQVEGVGPLTALTFVLTLEDPYRFEGSRSVGAYLGLVPARDRSGERDPQKRISKEGDEMLSVGSW